jgi:hypothetical protein
VKPVNEVFNECTIFSKTSACAEMIVNCVMYSSILLSPCHKVRSSVLATPSSLMGVNTQFEQLV